MTNTFASFFVFVIFFVLLNAVLKKREKPTRASEKRRKKGACIRGAMAPVVEKTRNTVR